MASRPPWLGRLFTEDDLRAIARAVTEAERRTSAEIRVHIERCLPGLPEAKPEALDRARQVFTTLGMHRTAARNGVLIYLAIEDRKLAVLGDEAIHRRVGDEYWQRVVDLMRQRFGADTPRDALVDAVGEIGRVLRQHFPADPGDTNELSDEVSAE